MNEMVKKANSGTSSSVPADEVIVGAGPAGLTAAHELTKHGVKPIVFESDSMVGGIARTENYKGFRFDIGGHRFFTKVEEVNQLWFEVLGDEFIEVDRKSRIFFRNKFFDYPLKILNVLTNLGLYESAHIMLSYLKWQVRPYKTEDTFEQWVINRFGGRLYWFFFQTYTEKVWGIPCTEIQSEWAEQRIKDLSLPKAIANAFINNNRVTSLINKFHYPRLGPGMMWERFQELVEQNGGTVQMETEVTGVRREGSRIVSVIARSGDQTTEIFAENFISSMPLPTLIYQLQPSAPEEVIEAASKLKHRDFIVVALILNKADPFPDNWIYIHEEKIKVGRIQNFRSWSAAMVPNQDQSCIGMDYFCHQGDGLWNMSEGELIELAKNEISELGLAETEDVSDGTVIRQPKAYPVYDRDYKHNVEVIKDYLRTFENLQVVGRNGMHRYNNQDHSMLTALLAAKNILGEKHDLWEVNLERSYQEEFVVKDKPVSQGTELARKTVLSSES